MRQTSPEAPVLRRTRRRLIAWSAGSTLVVLLVLGVAIYVAAATSLAAAGTRQLQARIDEITGASLGAGSVVTGPPGGPVVGLTSDPSQPGLVIGGDASGTIAFVMVARSGATGPLGSGVVAAGGEPVGVTRTTTVPGSAGTGCGRARDRSRASRRRCPPTCSSR